jgi:hypothetical protein
MGHANRVNPMSLGYRREENTRQVTLNYLPRD